MKFSNFPSVFFLLLFSAKIFSQTKLTVTLNVKNTEQKSIAANININGFKTKTDSSGSFRRIIESGYATIEISAVGHYPQTLKWQASKDTSILITLKERYSLLNSVIVRGSKNVTANQVSVQTISGEVLRKLPVIFGEADPLKTITLLPGVKSGGEGNGAIYVRGGGPDQNLVLLDGVNVYNPNHLLGFFSVFNGEAIKNIEVIKGGFPAEYGGRLSSVINITSRDGDMKEFKGSGSIGLISSKIGLEGPIKKNKGAFIVNARRTYIDQVVKPFAKERIGGSGYFFYDINARANWILNEKNKLELTVFNGQDVFSFSNREAETRTFTTNWGNTIGALNWSQKINKKLSQKSSIIYNQFGLDSKFGFSSLTFLFTSGLQDWQVKNEWQLKQNSWLNLRWGANYIYHTFSPGAGGVTAGVTNFKTELKKKYAHELAGYLSADIDLLPQLNMIAGVRYSHFNQVGPTEETEFDREGFPTGNNRVYAKGESVAVYSNPEPRVSLRYKFDNNSSIKMAYAKTIQYLQVATTSNASFPSDLWVPASKRVQPGTAQQVSGGYFKNFKGNAYEFSAEVYYKTLTNQIEFKPGANLILNANLENEMVFGTGKAYGIELFLQKKTGNFTGWIGYTLSRSERQFASINQGATFPYRYDRTHDLSLVGNYKINNKWDASAVFVYGTGNALTLPVGRFTYNLSYNTISNQPIFTNIDIYDKVNDFRMPAYHRLDISFNYTPKPNSTKRFKSSWNFGIYNVYNRYNPFFIYLSANTETQKVAGKKVFLFPIIPSVNWNFKF